MAEENSLLSHPFFSQPIMGAPPAEDLSARVAGSQAELPPPPTGRETLADVGKSIVSGGAKGLAGTIIGAPGSIETFATKDIPEALRAGAGYLAEKADIISPEQRREMTEKPIYSGQTPEQEKGYAAPLTGFPTYKAVTETFKPAMKEAGVPALAYEPQTGYGKTASAAAEFGAQGVPGALKGMAGRIATGAGAGAGSEFAAMSSQDPDSEGYNRLVGALGGAAAGAATSSVAGRLFNAVKAWAMPTGVAQNELMAMISEDIRRGLSPLTPEQLADAAARGTPVTILDMASPATLKKMGVSAEKAPAAEAAAAKYNDFLKERAASTSERVSGELSNIFQTPINAPVLQQAMEAAGKKTRDAIYTVMHATPEAQAIPMQVIGADVIARPPIQDAMRKAVERAKSNPEWNIVPPSRIPGRPGTESRWEQTPQGLREVPGTPAVPEQVTHGNLAYWDQVKRELDAKINAIKSPVEPNKADLATYVGNKEALVNRLDLAVKDYPVVRNIAADTFGAASAPEAGYLFFKNMDAFKRSDARKAFNQMTPDQKESFQIGFAHSIDEVANQPGGVANLAKKFTLDKNFKERAIDVLGREKYDQIQGTVLSENLLSKAKELRFIEQSSGIPGASLAGAAAGAAAEAGMIGSMALPPSALTSVIAGAVIGAAGKTFMNAMERQIAAKIVPMATSTDPSVISQLGKLASDSPAVAQVLNKIINTMNNKIVTGTGGVVTSQERPTRATGGRIGGSDIMKAAERAKKSIQQATKPLLATPDESVVKALAVANKNLEASA